MRLLPLLLLLLAGIAAAEGPGTRIRTNSQIPQPPQITPRDAADACARLKDEARERCLNEARRSVDAGRATGPGAAGGTAARGNGSSGTDRQR